MKAKRPLGTSAADVAACPESRRPIPHAEVANLLGQELGLCARCLKEVNTKSSFFGVPSSVEAALSAPHRPILMGQKPARHALELVLVPECFQALAKFRKPMKDVKGSLSEAEYAAPSTDPATCGSTAKRKKAAAEKDVELLPDGTSATTVGRQGGADQDL